MIGQHADTFQGGTFKLADGHILVESQLQDLFDDASNEGAEGLQKRFESISTDRQRADAVRVLVNDDMISEAERLLKQINSEHLKGEKEVLSGYILALKGKCNESKKLFDQALDINPGVCIPEKYRGVCE